MKYTVENWIDETVNVGGGDRPTFLVLNRYDLEMHNKEDDRTSLIFTSSSEVTAQITRVYYIDKFGREQNLEKRYPDNPNDNEWGYCRQHIIRSSSVTERSLVTTCRLRNVTRSDNNPQGFLIESFTIIENRDIGQYER